MFWRFGFSSTSHIDALLERESTTLEELFEEDELLQECKSHNAKLVDFLCRPEILQQLLNMILIENPDETKKFKYARSLFCVKTLNRFVTFDNRYPYLASEIFGCEIYAISDAVVSQKSMLESFWSLLDSSETINPLQASYFAKVNGILMQKKAADMVEFVKSQPKSIRNILVHVGNSSIAELLLKIISLEEIPEGQGIVPWLSGQGLIPSLVERLDPNLDIETHNTAAQTLLDIIAVSYQNVGPSDQEDGAPLNFGGGNALVDELKSEAIMRKIFGYMLDKTAPNATSSLSSGVIIMIELIRRYCSEIEQAEFQQHQFQTQMVQSSRPNEFGILPTPEKIKFLSSDLNDLLKVIGEKVEEFSFLLEHPRNLQLADTTVGKILPLGCERLRTCELFAEILHLQYLYFSSPLFERLVFGDLMDEDDAAKNVMDTVEDGNFPESLSKELEGMSLKRSKLDRNVADELAVISDLLVRAKVLPTCLSLFFQFPWNNFLHSVVYDMIAKVFNTYSFTSQSSNFAPVGPDGNEIVPLPGEEVVLTPLEIKMKEVSVVFKKLVISILVQGNLTVLITNAQRRNDYEIEQPKGVRLGYMGHLTYIADEVTKLTEKCIGDFDQDILGIELVNSDDWQEYLSGVLNETKDKDRQPLGGVRPTHTGQSTNFGKIDETDIPPLGAAPPPKKELSPGLSQQSTSAKEVDSDEDDELLMKPSELHAGGDVASDQMARFMCQVMVSDFPDRGILGDDDDDDASGLGQVIEEELMLDDTGFEMDNQFQEKASSLSFNDDDSSKATESTDTESNTVFPVFSISYLPGITRAQSPERYSNIAEASSPLHKQVLIAEEEEDGTDHAAAVNSGTSGASTPIVT
ncbi:hypothetical protein HDU83_004041 [Entophlyctis luteolus]|nr:hypothetical protein HDU83_004041 [Entophlyctis luteolus]